MSRGVSVAGDDVVNAMSIDVEDYFHVSVFDGIVPRIEWERMESRVVANTTRLLDLFDEFRVRSTFFVLGWVAERHAALVRTIAERGHEVASHGYAHRLIYDQTPSAFRDDVRRAKQILEDAAGRRVVGYRAPSYSITPRSLWALDVLLEEGYEYRLEHFPDPARSLRHSGLGSTSLSDRTSAWQTDRSSRLDDTCGPGESPGRRWRVLSHPSILVDELGDTACEPARTPSGGVLPAPVGDRP